MRIPSKAVTAALVAVVGLVAGVTAAASHAAAQSCLDPFTAEFRNAVAQQLPGQRATAAVHDTRTGCWYHLHLGT